MKRVRHTQYQTEPIQIKNQEQFTAVASSYMKKQKLEITCQECKKNFFVYLLYATGLVCPSCKIKLTKKARYGSPSYNNRQKAKQTCKDKFGVEYYSQTKEGREKISNFFQNKDLVERRTQKRFQTIEAKYGNLENYKIQLIQSYKKTCKQKYGVENISQLQDIKLQKKKTLKARFGEDVSYRDLLQKGLEKKYGVKNIFSLSNYKTGRKRTVYAGYQFDSSLEVQLFKFLTDVLKLIPEVDFEMQKKYPKPFLVEEEFHNTFVDFYLKSKDIWIECKGKQFFNFDGSAAFPYGSKDKRYKSMHEKLKYLWESKLSFLRSEKILIFTGNIEEIKAYII